MSASVRAGCHSVSHSGGLRARGGRHAEKRELALDHVPGGRWTGNLTTMLDGAAPLYERTLVESERVLGPDHPGTLGSRNNLAAAYQAVGRTTEAEALQVH
jgi:Tetratricopeptide repeat